MEVETIGDKVDDTIARLALVIGGVVGIADCDGSWPVGEVKERGNRTKRVVVDVCFGREEEQEGPFVRFHIHLQQRKMAALRKLQSE